MVESAAQGVEVGVNGPPAERARQEGEELGGTKWTRGGALCCVSAHVFTAVVVVVVLRNQSSFVKGD